MSPTETVGDDFFARISQVYGKQDRTILFGCKTENDKAREHFLTGAHIDVRDRNKAERNAEMRSL